MPPVTSSMTSGPRHQGDQSWKLSVSERVFAVAASPTSPTLLAVGTKTSITVLRFHFPEEKDGSAEEATFDATLVKEINHDGRVHCLAWPTHSSAPYCPPTSPLTLASGGAGGQVRVFTLGPGGATDVVRALPGHTDYVNDLAFQPGDDEPALLATGSDDCNLILHRLHGRSGSEGVSDPARQEVPFGSPVMSVRFHTSEEAKLMVALRSGVIHFINSLTLNPIQSIDCGLGPLAAADWSVRNSLLVLAAIRSEIIVWDLSRPASPAIVRQGVHEDGARHARFACGGNQSATVVASAGQPAYAVKVLDVKTSRVLHQSARSPVGGLDWHKRLEYLFVGRDQYVSVHKI